MNYRTAMFKKTLELTGMYPFVLLGKLAGRLFPLKSRHSIFMFCASADIGGSIKVNADIANCIKDKKPVIIFSKKPKNNQFRDLFNIEGVRVIDLHKYIDNKWYHFVNFFFRGVLASWINQVPNPVVFGGESLFFYKIIPHVKKETRTVELCHLNTWFPFSLAFIDDIDYRIFSTPQIKRDVEKQYRENQLPQKYFDRLHFIDNKVDIPELKEIVNPVLEVLYVGRGAPQKRVHLIAAIAKQMHDSGRPVHFSFVGDVEKVVPVQVQHFTGLYGQIKDPDQLSKVYTQADVLILTSAYEGLPIVVMDMMARGKIVISTAVDGIPDYITHLETGLLIEETDEAKIIEKGIACIELLIENAELRKKIGKASYQYAVKHFSGEVFCKVYHEILVPGENNPCTENN